MVLVITILTAPVVYLLGTVTGYGATTGLTLLGTSPLVTSSYFFFSSFWLTSSLATFMYIYVAKLVVSWFLIVWLRLNLLRYRFDQVASYTWHELLIYAVAILVEIIIAFLVL